MNDIKNIPLGEILKSYGYITEEQLQKALERQKTDKTKRIGDILIEMGFLTERQKLEALGQRLGIPLVRLDLYSVDSDSVGKIPKNLALKYNLIAIDQINGRITLAVNDPLNFFAIENIRQIVKLPLDLCLAESRQITDAIEYHYSEIQARQAAASASPSLEQQVVASEKMSDANSDVPAVKLLNSLLSRGYNTGASDIHIEPFEDSVSIRIRTDGTLVDYMKVSSSLHQSLISRIKILSDLDIAEKRLPQDGHFRIRLDGMDINIRVSVIPTIYGEKAVLRFLCSNAKIDNDDKFGMSPENHKKMLRALQAPYGIIYVCGPTGSGKTTTLYMLLEYLSQRKVNIATIEDPVERNLSRVNQTQVNNTSGLTFETGLRSILRQDPDIIMLGETRDTETATISVRAAITGHLVLSTLHTNDAVSATVRLNDMGIPRYLIANSLVAAVSQRLVRKVCGGCAHSYKPTEAEREIIGEDVDVLWKGKGCPLCSQTGYRGRVAVHEILLIDKNIRKMISEDAPTEEIFQYASKVQGMRTLRENALALVKEGVTTVEELIKTSYYGEM